MRKMYCAEGQVKRKRNPRWISKHLGSSGSVIPGFSDVDGHHRHLHHHAELHRHHRHGERRRHRYSGGRHCRHRRYSAERWAPNNRAGRWAPNNRAVHWAANNCGARSCAATECRSEARQSSCGCRHCKRAAYSCGYHCLKACTRGSRCSWLAAG